MGFYEEQVLPRCIDLLLGTKRMGKLRARAMDGLSGTVLEIGFGSGTNVPWYPPGVERVLAVDPSGVARKLSAGRVGRSGVPVEFVGLDGQSIPLPGDSVDNALSTWTLCTVPDAAAALREVHRVLLPGGELYFLEHGRSPDARVAHRQDRLNGLQNRVAGGCNLNRDMAALLEASPLEIVELASFAIPGPKVMSWMYAGRARKP